MKACAAPSGYQLVQLRQGSLRAALADITLKLSHVGRARGWQGARLSSETPRALVLLWRLHSETVFTQGCKLRPSCSYIYKRGWGSPDGVEQLAAGEGAVDETCLSPGCAPPAGARATGGSEETSALAAYPPITAGLGDETEPRAKIFGCEQ